MAARHTEYAESLSSSATTATATKLSLTFTPSASSSYLIFFSAILANTSSTSWPAYCYLKDATAGTTLATLAQTPYSTGDRYPFCSFYRFQSGSTPPSQSFNLDYDDAALGGSQNIQIESARMLALKFSASDQYAESLTEQTRALTSFATAATLTFTPATAGEYIIFAYAEVTNTSSSNRTLVRATYSGTNYGSLIYRPKWTTHDYIPWSTMFKLNLGTSSTSITIGYASSSTGSSAKIKNCRLFAFRVDQFDAEVSGELRGRSTISNTTYNDVFNNNFSHALENQLYFTCAIGDGNNVSASKIYIREDEAGSQLMEMIVTPPTGANIGWPLMLGMRTNPGTSPTLYNVATKTVSTKTAAYSEMAMEYLRVGTVSTGATINAPTTALALAAVVPTVSTGVNIVVPTATLSLSGVVPAVSTGTNIQVPTATLSLSSVVPTVSTGANITGVPTTSLSLTGIIPSSISTGVIIEYPFNFPGLGQNMLFVYNDAFPPAQHIEIEIPAETKDLSLSAVTPTISTGANIAVPTTALSLSGIVPSVSTGSNITVSTKAMALTAVTPTVSAGSRIDVPTTDLSLIGIAPIVSTGALITVPTTALVLAAIAPDIEITADTIIEVDTVALILDAPTPTIVTGSAILVPTAELILDAVVPGIVGGESTVIEVDTVALELEAFPPAIYTGASIKPHTPSIGLTGIPPEIRTGRSILVPTAVLSLLGVVPAVSTGAIIRTPTSQLVLVGVIPRIDLIVKPADGSKPRGNFTRRSMTERERYLILNHWRTIDGSEFRFIDNRETRRVTNVVLDGSAFMSIQEKAPQDEFPVRVGFVNEDGRRIYDVDDFVSAAIVRTDGQDMSASMLDEDKNTKDEHALYIWLKGGTIGEKYRMVVIGRMKTGEILSKGFDVHVKAPF